MKQSSVAHFVTQFGSNRRGSVAIIFAISVFAVLGIVGLAVDYVRLVSTRQELQSLADGALVAAAMSAKTGTDIQDAATAHFNTNWASKTRQSTASITVADMGNNELSGVASTLLPMTFMRVMGFKTVAVGVKASIVYGQGSAELALVLDTTGSMSGGPLQDLQSASTTLLDTIYAAPGADQKVKVSVVPFAQYVNVGQSNRHASWMSVPNDTSTTANVCYANAPLISQTNCSTQTATGYNDGVPFTYQYQQCTNTYGTPVTTCGPQTVTSTWNGCAGSRTYPLDDSAAVTSGQPVPGVMDVWCGAEVLRLTNDRSAVDNAIAGLSAGGETFIPAGLLWGWRTLSPEAPYADATSSTAARKVMVLMTDGANTRSPNYPDHEGYDATQANTLMAETCTAIKAAKITVYTVAFNVTDQAAKDRLTACASSAAQFFDAPSASDLKTAFGKIGQAMAAIYLKS